MTVAETRSESIAALRSSAFDRLAACAAVIDGLGAIIDTNEAWRLFAHLNGGSTATTGLGVNYLSVCDRSATAASIAVAHGLRLILAGDRERFEFEYPCPSPIEDRWFMLFASSAPVDAGAGAVLFHVDITARKLMTDRLVELAETDTLTGLPNRRAATRFIGQQLVLASTRDRPVWLLYFDIDDFKDVNDRYGHHAGDDLLSKVAARTTRAVRSQDRLCRLGGDEFVLVCPGLGQRQAVMLAQRLRSVMSEPFQIDATEVLSGVSVGIASSESGSTVDSLLRAADADMYEDKRRPSRTTTAIASVAWHEPPFPGFPRWESPPPSDFVVHALGLRTEVADAVIVTDLDDFRVQSFNRAAEELYGWSNSEVVGRPLNEVNTWIGSERQRLRADRQLHTAGRWHGQLSVRSRDGSTIQLLGSTTLVRDDSGRAIGAVMVNRPVLGSARPGSGRRVDPAVAAQIQQATANSEFIVHYQPVVRLADQVVVGVEALARWQHPKRGLLPPEEFIDDAERSGHIIELGQSVLQIACNQAKSWHDAGEDLYLAVNLSCVQLFDDRLPERLAATLAATGLPAGKLWLEITETSLVQDLDKATRSLHAIRDLGVSISIDDFGTGWASLVYLRQFPVNALKIDRLFVAGLGLRTRDAAIAHSIISLADELGLDVVAEGIETAEQAAALVELGCIFGQGFLFGRPEPAGEKPGLRHPTVS
ncbi:MAG: EAL domain-containing protein [Ilumatobacteraceae bacterium]